MYSEQLIIASSAAGFFGDDMKRFLKLFLLCIILMPVFCCHAFAQDLGTCGTNVKYVISENTITFTRTDDQMEAFWDDCGDEFKDRSDIKIVQVNDEIGLTYGQSAFKEYPYVEEMYLSNLDVSSVENMQTMFRESKKLQKVDMSGWDTSSVEDMNYMFLGCTALKEVKTDDWDTSAVTEMAEMFYECESLMTLDAGSWKTFGVTDMHAMFWHCTSLQTVDMSGWDTGAVTDMHGMFGECPVLTELDVSNWDVSSVELMNGLFYSCSSLTELNVSNWDVSSATNISGVFSGCSSLTTVDVSGWDTSGAEDMNHMFWNCSSLETVDVSSFDTSNVSNLSYMFYNCKNLQTVDVSGWDTSAVNNVDSMFSGCSSLTELDVSGWDTSAVTSSANAFEQCGGIAKLVLGGKTQANNIFASLPNYKSDWIYEEPGESASDPLPIGTIKENGELFTAYTPDSMAGTWVVTEKPALDPMPDPGRFFPILSDVCVLPATGFSSRQETVLPGRPRTYAPLAMTLQIPRFDAEIELTRIPQTENSWSAEWLGEKAGVLEGYALPGEGYSIIAAHNTLNDTAYGPFGRLSELDVNDIIFVKKANGSLLRFRVYAGGLVLPDDFESLKRTAEKEAGSLILVTCENESMKGGYLNRRVIFAKPE